MKLTKKTIVSNTLLFVIIIGFILAFGAVFGTDNILIGVSTITAMLMLLERDLTSQPVANTMKFIGLNLFIGVAAFLTGFNVWLAVPIHFIVMFVISYTLLFNLKNPLYLPFSLQYLFLLAVPVAAGQMPLRLASLVFGALAIMGVQLLFNKNKITKSGSKKIQAICEGLIKKIDLLKKEEPAKETGAQIMADISGLRSIIYDKREENYYLTEEGSLKLNISVALEKMNLLIDDQCEDGQAAVLDDVKRALELATLQDAESVQLLGEHFQEMLRKYKAEHNHDLLVLGMLNHIGFLHLNLAELRSLGKGQNNVVKNLERIPKKFQKMTISETPSHTNSVKLSYAVRMALGITIAGFITDYFDLTEGRWMMFTVLSVVIPLYEQSQKKMRDRIFATIVGGIAVALSFTVFQSNTARSILLMTAGYLMNYIKVYRYSTILVTFSAIGSVALVTNATQVLTVERVGFVAAGVVLAILLNKFVLPYKLEDANRDLRAMYEDTTHEMLLEVDAKSKGGGREHAIKNLLLITTMIEDRIKLNNQGDEGQERINWLKHQRRMAGTLYELFGWLDRRGVGEANAATIHAAISMLLNRSGNDVTESIENVKHEIETTVGIEDRMILSMIFEVMMERKRSKDILQPV